MTTDKLPREGTMARALVDYWKHEGECSFSELLDIYCESSPSRMSRDQRQRAGMTITLLLKKYGHKLGARGSRAAWKFGPRPLDPKLVEQISAPRAPEQPMYNGRKLFKFGDVVRYPDGQLATIDDRLLDVDGTSWGPMNGDSGYWPITWKDPSGKPHHCCGSPGDKLTLVEPSTSPFSDQIFDLQRRIYRDEELLKHLKEKELRYQRVRAMFMALSDDEKSEMSELCCDWETEARMASK